MRSRDEYHPFLFVGGPRHGRFYATNGASMVVMPVTPDISVAAQQSWDRASDVDPTITTADYELRPIGGTHVYVFRR